MIKRLSLTPREYHSTLPFHVANLPALEKCGYVSASILSAARDPMQMILCPRKETGEMQWGSLVDCLWTTPSLFSKEYVVLPDDAPKDVRHIKRIAEAKKPSKDSLDSMAWWNEFDQTRGGRTPITSEDYDNAKAAIRMLAQHDVAQGIYEESDRQVVLAGDGVVEDGVKVKAMMDLLPMDGSFVDAIVDLKTTGQFDDRNLVSTSFTFDYPIKLAFYGMLAEAAGLGERLRGVLIWQQSDFPYQVKVREIPKAQMACARTVVRKRFNKLRTITPANMTPFINTPMEEMPLPDWVMNAYLRE